ncbi:hypothetical protein EVA_01080 [gut metagenome]|uniref:Uncharacterized protein n=1 Tax=gut metagenome TaxID=749906 RepID=J9GRI2_9ZZZZ
MSKSITFNVKVLVDGKEQVVSMTSNVKELQNEQGRILGGLTQETRSFATAMAQSDRRSL